MGRDLLELCERGIPVDRDEGPRSEREGEVTYHVVPSRVMAADVMKLTRAKTVQGQSVSVNTTNGVHIDGATVTRADISAEHGVIHVTDSVILPN